MVNKNNNGVIQENTPLEPEEQLRSLANALADAMFILKTVRNRKGHIIDFVFTMANQAGEKLLGRKLEEILGRKLSEVFPSSHPNTLFPNSLLDSYTRVTNTQKILEEETVLNITKEKSVRIHQRISPFEDGIVAVIYSQGIQKQVEESVIAPVAEYQELADHISEAFFALNASLHFKHWNKAAETLFGHPARATTSKTIWEVFPEWKGSSLERLFTSSIRTKRPQTIVNEYRKNDALLYLEVRVYPTQSGLHVFVKDITQRKRSEEALKVSKAHLSQILNTVDEVVFSYRVQADGDFVYDYFSSATFSLWGYSPEELIENKYLLVSCILPEHQDTFNQSMLEQVLSDEVVTLEYPFRHRDGSVRWILNKLIPHRNPNGLLIITGIAVDVTHRKTTNERIQLNNEVLEERVAMRTEALEGLINAIPDPIYVVEQEGLRISYCNTIFAQTLGFESRDQVQGKTVAECFSASEAERFLQYSQSVFKGGQIVHEHETLDQKDGSHHYDAYKVPLRNRSGQIYALLGISHDITELINARHALSRQTAQLETTNNELEAFSYSVSHDLRAPLRAIDGYTRILLEDFGDRIDNEGKRIIHVITYNAIKMGQLIDNLLDFSRLGRKELIKLQINTNNLIDSIIVDLKRQNMDRQLTWDIKSLQPSTGDVNMLKQVWINLVSNAVKYTRNQPQARIEIGSQPAENENIFYVKDNGVGFDMQYTDKLFGVFQRLHSEEEFEGTGVGLAIAQRIVARHGGRIWAEGEPGVGATFFFSLPC
jgi:PAS domain S-box-containing protein